MIRTEVVQSIQDDVKASEPLYIKLWFLDVGVNGVDMHVRVECSCGLRGNLESGQAVQCKQSDRRTSKAYHGLALLNVLLLEEKLSVEIGEVYGIQV